MDKYERRRLALKNLVEDLGRGGIAAVASKIGKDTSYVSRMLYEPDKSGRKRIGEDTWEALCIAYPAAFSEQGGSALVSVDETPAGYVRFPLLEGFLAAGGGGYMPDYPEVVQYLDVAEDWAERNIRAPRSAVRVITARGDSMTGDISDGDVLFVDSRVQGFDTDSIYVMNWQGRPLVKRLQLRRDGSVVIRSTNPAYEPETVPPGEIDQLFISGRVLAAWGFKKF
jgi:phage repressor protein C with HTH and peptisase S24 domain